MNGDQKNPSDRSPWATSPRTERRLRAEEPRSSPFKKWIIAAVLIFLVAAGFFIYRFIVSDKEQASKISLEFSRPGQILIGEPFSISISISNYADNVLKNAKLSLLLPAGVYFVGQSNDQRVSEQVVGDVGPGSINQQTFTLLALSGGESARRLEARLGYSFSQTSSAQFESSAVFDVLVSQSAVALDVGVPQNVFNGQDFDVTIKYANNSGREFKDAHLKIDYPPVFGFKKSSVATEGIGNNSWYLGNVPGGGKGSIVITGTLAGAAASVFNFVAELTSSIAGNIYTVTTQTANTAISESPLSISLAINNGGGADYISRLGDALVYTIDYKNNSNVVMQNVRIEAKLAGEVFDFSKLKTNGYFNSLTNTIAWLPANENHLSSVLPQQGGSVQFSISIKDAFPIRLLSDKNYTLKLQARIESPTVPQNISADKTSGVATLENKVQGKMNLVAEAYWRDAATGILNSGPYPPRVNQPTQYTVHWRLTNYATDATGVKVSAFLQSGARFTGKVKSNIDVAPLYNPNSGLVTWEIPFVPATKGIIGAPAEAVFQVEATPSVNQVGSHIPFLGETSLELTDAFVNQPFRVTAQSLDTSLPNDRAIQNTDRAVRL